MILTKVLQGVVGGFSGGLVPWPKSFSGSRAAVSGLVQGLWLVQCPSNLCVPFNEIIREVHGREAPPMDLELTHYLQRVPEKKKKGEKNWGKIRAWDLAPKTPAV